MKQEGKRFFTVRNMVFTALFAALICVAAPFAVQAGPIPITLATFAVYLAGAILGGKLGMVAVAVYILIGAVGLPVFSGFRGGFAVLTGPTGGYIIGYIFMALVIGFFVDKWQKNYVLIVMGMLLGTAVLYLFGTLWLAKQGGMSFGAALGAGVIPFIPGDLVKMALALLVGTQVKKSLWQAGILEKQCDEP